MNKKKKALVYVLVNKNGNFITTDHKLPFYWNKKVAKADAELFKAEIRRANINDLIELIS